MDLKRLAAEKSIEYVRDGMTLGLGTGTTAYWAIRKIGDLVHQGMKLRGIPSSHETERLAKELQIPLVSFAEVEQIDVTIDGADEIDQNLRVIKGGGGALLREKIVATASKLVILVADDSKWVTQLGKRPLPVEVVPFGWQMTAKRIANRFGCTPVLRAKEAMPFSTDNRNYILDCDFEQIDDPVSVERELKTIPGVIENGLFIDIADVVILGSGDGVHVHSWV